MTLFFDPIPGMFFQVRKVFSSENLYAFIAGGIQEDISDFCLQALRIIATAYQGNAGLVATHLTDANRGLEQLSLQPAPIARIARIVTSGTARKGEKLIPVDRDDIKLKMSPCWNFGSDIHLYVMQLWKLWIFRKFL